MSREYAIESSKLPLSIRGTLSQPAVRGVYLEELPDRVSDTSEISSDRYSVIEDDLMNVDGISDTSCPFTHSYAAYIYILESGTYRFYVRSNFGAEATIYDGERGVSTGVTCGAQAESSSVEEITFARRGYYKVEVKYYSTGEASPVLELHFGESSPDMASRSELPVFRDFYILETEYATLLGDGSVLRPGETCTIDLHNISEYYSIYGGSVTVWRADGVKTYPLEYDRVTIPMASILAGNVYPSSGCSARVTVLASSGGGCGCGCGCGEGGTSRTFTFDATVVPENYRENNDNQRVCACSNKTIAENTHCISFSQNIGRTPWVEGTPVGQVFIEEDKPSQAITDAANRRNQAMIFTRNKLVIYLNKWIKKCKCVYKNMLNVVIVVLWLLTLSYNLNANEIEMKLVKTIESNPTYMSFDEMEKSLILCFIDDENKVKYQEYNIASQKINKINNRVPTGVPKLINKVKFVTECQLYKKDDYGEHQVDKTDLWFFGYSSNIILKKKNTTGYEVVWSMPLGKDRRCECIFRSDSVFPYLLIEDDGQWMIYDSKDKSLIKTIKIVSNVFVHQIYLSEFLDNIVSENKIDDIDFATTIFIPKEDWQKKVKENRLTLPPLLSFFPDDNGFSKNEAKFKFQLLAPYRYEGLCFLDRNTVGMIISIGTRMRLTGETRLLLYHFDKNIIFVNKRITPNMCFSPKRFTPDNIAFSQNGKYLAYCYDKKIYIYQLNQSSKED